MLYIAKKCLTASIRASILEEHLLQVGCLDSDVHAKGVTVRSPLLKQAQRLRQRLSALREPTDSVGEVPRELTADLPSCGLAGYEMCIPG